jgi:DNA repair protein RadC
MWSGNSAMTQKLEKSMRLTKAQKATINEAMSILASLYQRKDLHATSPDLVKKYCQLQLGALEYEVFAILMLDNKNRLIKFDQMFRGTINHATIHPREVAREVLMANAASVIFTHNHPSGNVEPSRPDLLMTAKLTDCLELFEVRVLDHIIVSGEAALSLAELGLL